MICEHCGTEFDAKRKTAKYCGAKCRKLAFQESKVGVPENANAEVSVPSHPVDSNTPEGVKQALRKMKPKISKDIDNEHSPDFDLSEAGFIRRNENWFDDITYPGKPGSRKELMQKVAGRHARIMRQQQANDDMRTRMWEG